MTLNCGPSYLFLPFVLEAQTRGAFLEALAVIGPRLVGLELHRGFDEPPSREKKKARQRERHGHRERWGSRPVNGRTAASPLLSASAVGRWVARSLGRGGEVLSEGSRGSRHSSDSSFAH